MSAREVLELAGIYAADTGLPLAYCAALVKQDREPTPELSRRVTERGFDAAEVAAMLPFLREGC